MRQPWSNRPPQFAVFGVLSLCMMMALGPTSIQAASAEKWKVGLAAVKITPQQPVMLSGYASRNHPFEKVTTDLYAKALALEDGAGHLAVLVTTDLLGLPAAVAEPVCKRIEEKTGLDRSQILLSSSHIHTGPALKAMIVGEKLTDPGDAQRTIAYTRELQDKLVEVVIRSLQERKPARLSWGSGVANFVLNRRQWTPRGVILGANPRGPADRTVPVLRVGDLDGKPRAVLFGAATHNTTLFPQCYEVCGDYAGFAQAYLEEKHPSVQAMFALGFAGDSDPYPRGTMELARNHGTALGQEVDRVLAGKLQPVHGPLSVAFGHADLPLKTPPPREELTKRAAQKSGIQAENARHMLAILKGGEKLPTHYSCPIAVWQFGKDLTLVALSGEVVVDYVALLEKALGPNQLWLAAYCNDVFGYVPSARVLAEGGYETRGLYAGGVGTFDPPTEEVLVHKTRELAGKAGRSLPRNDR